MNRALILLTRPRRESRLAAAELRAAGFEVLRAPLQFTRAAAPSRSLDADLAWATGAAIQIFVSRAAVAAACARATSAVSAAGLRLAVGSATAAALRERGFPCEMAPAGAEDSDGLLGLPSLQSVQGQRIALWAAPGGRDRLATALTARGAEVRFIYIYRRVPLRPPARVLQQLQRAPEHLVLTATSGALLAELDRVLRRAGLDTLRSRPLIVASERIAELARGRGYIRVEVAAGASSQALIQALQKSTNPDPKR
ncbi:MAG: uroporphyrinogen-III synthase [Lysobacterales bacterium]